MAARTNGKKKAKAEEPKNPYADELTPASQNYVQGRIEAVQMAQNLYDGSADGFYKLGALLIDIEIRLRRLEEHLDLVIET